ncbi:methyltransferase [Streptomyces sp. BBFR115]|uniref:methyltransferase n=1 Tax=Streptomyces sp. BBFR115 TaxID=3448173 RepID=UPI003F760E19
MTEQQSVDQELANEVAKISSLMGPWAVRVASTLRLPDHIAAGTTKVSELAQLTGSDPDVLGRLLRYLSVLGVFREEAPGEYQVTELGEFFRDDHPMKLRRFLDQNGFGAKLDAVTARLEQGVRTGRTVYEDVFGRRFWEDQDDYPDPELSFNTLMADHTRWFGPDIRDSFDWGAHKLIVDVGGGTGAGTLLHELLTHFPGMRGILVEDPRETATSAAGSLGPIGDRCTLVRQSLFEPMPQGGDVYVLTNILRNWNQQDAIRILRRCAEAAGPDGDVLVLERILSAEDQHQIHVADANLRILLLLGGKERTLEEFREIGRAAGLDLTATTPTGYSHMYLIRYSAAGRGHQA